jgi:hypothetical protein
LLEGQGAAPGVEQLQGEQRLVCFALLPTPSSAAKRSLDLLLALGRQSGLWAGFGRWLCESLAPRAWLVQPDEPSSGEFGRSGPWLLSVSDLAHQVHPGSGQLRWPLLEDPHRVRRFPPPRQSVVCAQRANFRMSFTGRRLDSAIAQIRVL